MAQVPGAGRSPGADRGVFHTSEIVRKKQNDRQHFRPGHFAGAGFAERATRQTVVLASRRRQDRNYARSPTPFQNPMRESTIRSMSGSSCWTMERPAPHWSPWMPRRLHPDLERRHRYRGAGASHSLPSTVADRDPHPCRAGNAHGPTPGPNCERPARGYRETATGPGAIWNRRFLHQRQPQHHRSGHASLVGGSQLQGRFRQNGRSHSLCGQ